MLYKSTFWYVVLGVSSLMFCDMFMKPTVAVLSYIHPEEAAVASGISIAESNAVIA
jgi:hypothetical protein